MNRYQLENGPDGITWVSIQPLMEDINENIVKMMDMDVSELSEENQKIFELKILGLRTVHQFLGALVTEKSLEKLRTELQGRQDVDMSKVLH